MSTGAREGRARRAHHREAGPMSTWVEARRLFLDKLDELDSLAHDIRHQSHNRTTLPTHMTIEWAERVESLVSDVFEASKGATDGDA